MLNRLNAPGVALAYSMDGPAEAPVLMLANSLAADMAMWKPNIEAFTARCRVLRYDMRGHGDSSTPPGECGMAQLADDAVALLDELRIDKVHFVGLSLGGMVGQQLGARYGGRLKSLSLCCTMSHQVAPAAWADRLRTVRAEGLQSIVDSTLQRWFTPAFIAREPGTIQWVREMILRTRPEGYATCAAAVRDLAQTALLQRIRVPTQVLAGELDVAATPAIAHDMCAQIDGARCTVLPGVAHLPNIEQPQLFARAVLDFIDAVEGAGVEGAAA